MSRLTSVRKLSKSFTMVFAASIFFCTACPVFALEFGGKGGTWPKSWPKELEPLRKQAWTWVFDSRSSRVISYEFSFANREDFESAWPRILKVKAPVTLLRGPHRIGDRKTPQNAAVRIRTHTTGMKVTLTADVMKRLGITLEPALQLPVTTILYDLKMIRLMDSKALINTVVTGIELVVDGDIVDLNRIRLPADTPIIDKRFKGAAGDANAIRKKAELGRPRPETNESKEAPQGSKDPRTVRHATRL